MLTGRRQMARILARRTRSDTANSWCQSDPPLRREGSSKVLSYRLTDCLWQDLASAGLLANVWVIRCRVTVVDCLLLCAMWTARRWWAIIAVTEINMKVFADEIEHQLLPALAVDMALFINAC